MKEKLQEYIPKLLEELEGLDLTSSLNVLAHEFPGAVTYSSGFGIEGQVISHVILDKQLAIEIFTLDTGRLFPETYSVWNRTIEQYDAKIKAYFPDHSLLETHLKEKGPNAFYESVENRMECCYIRKVEPLKRALIGKSIWITGLRAEHSPSRKALSALEWDESNQVIKFHPLLNWSTAEVKGFIQQNNIPYNPLHDQGFISIGCAPCTRAIKPGEDFRAGRWWWENNTRKECGLHSRTSKHPAIINE